MSLELIVTAALLAIGARVLLMRWASYRKGGEE